MLKWYSSVRKLATFGKRSARYTKTNEKSLLLQYSHKYFSFFVAVHVSVLVKEYPKRNICVYCVVDLTITPLQWEYKSSPSMNLRKCVIKPLYFNRQKPSLCDLDDWMRATYSCIWKEHGRELKCSSFSNPTHKHICVLEKSWFYSILFYQLVVRWRSISIDIHVRRIHRNRFSIQALYWDTYIHVYGDELNNIFLRVMIKIRLQLLVIIRVY